MRASFLLLLAAVAAPAAAGPEQPPAAAAPIGLRETVRLAFQYSPEIQRARAQVELRAGARRQAAGAYDSVFQLTPSLDYTEGLLSSATRGREENRRTQLRIAADAFAKLRKALADAIARRDGKLPVCPLEASSLRVQLGGDDDFPFSMCVPVDQELYDRNDASQLAALANILADSVGSGTGDLDDMLQRLSKLLGMQIEDFAESQRQRGWELTQQAYLLAGEAETRARLALERLGNIADYEFHRTAKLDLELSKAYRKGTLAQFSFKLSGVEDNFRDKPLDPRFGGKGIQNLFQSSVALSITQPLLKGRGSVSAEAPDRAAVANLEATQQRFQHTVAQQTLAALSAHFDLLAAQQSLAAFEESVGAQRKIVDGTRELVKAGEESRSELTRTEARLAETEANLASARISLLQARASYAQKVGVGASLSGDGPQAAGAFPAMPIEVDIPGLSRRAAERRADLKAAGLLRDASHYLFEANRNDLQNRLDLSFRVGAASTYYGPYFRVLRDELTARRYPLESLDDPVDFYQPAGMWRAIQGRWEPNFAIQLTFDLPFGNHAAKGRLAQADATLRRSEIQAADLGRVVNQTVYRAGETLRRARAELDNRRLGASQSEFSWKATQDLRKAGEMTLIDALITEQNYTSARVQLAQAQRDYATALASFRFETGTLVQFKDGEPVGTDLTGLLAE